MQLEWIINATSLGLENVLFIQIFENTENLEVVEERFNVEK